MEDAASSVNHREENPAERVKLCRIINKNGANCVRAGPSLEDKETTILPQNTVFEILKHSENKLEIECKTCGVDRGWIPSEDGIFEVVKDIYQIIHFKGAKVREGKEADSKQVSVLPGGTYLSSCEQFGNELRIDYPVCGWVSIQSSNGIPLVAEESGEKIRYSIIFSKDVNSLLPKEMISAAEAGEDEEEEEEVQGKDDNISDVLNDMGGADLSPNEVVTAQADPIKCGNLPEGEVDIDAGEEVNDDFDMDAGEEVKDDVTKQSGVKFAETVVVTHTLHTQTHSLDPPTSDLFWSEESPNSADVILPDPDVVISNDASDVRDDEQVDTQPHEPMNPKKKKKRKTLKLAAMFDKMDSDVKNFNPMEKVGSVTRHISAETAARKKIFEDREKKAAELPKLINSKTGDKFAPTSSKNKMMKICAHCNKTLYPNDPQHYNDGNYFHQRCWLEVEKNRIESEGKASSVSGVDSGHINRKAALEQLNDRVLSDKTSRKTICPGCGEDIWVHEREHSFYGQYYHAGCFKCSNCPRVFEKSETIYSRRREAFCYRCFHDLFQHEFATDKTFTQDDMFQVSGHGMVFTEMGGERLPLLFKGILKKTLSFVTINVQGDKWVHPLNVCPFGEEPIKHDNFSEEELEVFAENKAQLPRSTLFEDTTAEQWKLFLDELTADGQRLGWITYTCKVIIPDTGMLMQKDTTCLIHWNPPDSETRRQVVFSAAKDELHRMYIGGLCFVVENIEELSQEAMSKRMSEIIQA